MGSYAYLKIGEIIVGSSKNDFDPTVMMLFTDNDKYIAEVIDNEGSTDSNSNEEEYPYLKVEYSITLQVARDRLDYMGFTLDRARQLFDEGVQNQINELIARQSRDSWSKHEFLRESLQKELELLGNYKLEDWIQGFQFILNNKLKEDSKLWYDYESKAECEYSPTVCYMLGAHNDYYSFPALDARAFLRSAVEVLANAETLLSYDVSALINGGYFNPTDDLAEWARRDLVEDFAVNHKTIVLTEGKSDKSILEGSLKLLYPHLVQYYSFMDFDTAKAPGGASELVGTLKAFIGAGIVNRTVAFFDNDTAAKTAMRSLAGIKLPDSVKVFNYPDLAIATDYPTLGPQGIIEMNINGLAGSIELYFGHDVLLNPDGTLTPVQWKGFDPTLRQYQGEILNKTELQARFYRKLNDCISNPLRISGYDWSGIRAILDVLRTAFH
jgi:hypothetical protein